MYLCTFRDGEPAPFSLAVLDKLLGPFIEFRSHHRWSLSFPNGGRSFLYLKDDQKEIDHVCVNPANRQPGIVDRTPRGPARDGRDALLAWRRCCCC